MKTFFQFIKENTKDKPITISDSDMNTAYSKIEAICQKHNATLNKGHFDDSHFRERMQERGYSADSIVRLFSGIEEKTTFFDDLQKINNQYEKNKSRKYGPQLVDDKQKIHVGMEVKKKGKTFELITKSVMKDFNWKYINGLRSGRSKAKIYSFK